MFPFSDVETRQFRAAKSLQNKTESENLIPTRLHTDARMNVVQDSKHHQRSVWQYLNSLRTIIDIDNYSLLLVLTVANNSVNLPDSLIQERETAVDSHFENKLNS